MLNEEFVDGLFKELLLESTRRNNLIEAMKNRWICRLYYNGDSIEKKKGWRVVEIFAYGESKYGHQVIRAWQKSGVSDTPHGDGFDPLKAIEGWRYFRVDRIGRLEYLKHNKPFSTDRPKYNPHDKDMATVYYAVPKGEPEGNDPDAVDTRPQANANEPVPRKTERKIGSTLAGMDKKAGMDAKAGMDKPMPSTSTETVKDQNGKPVQVPSSQNNTTKDKKF